VKSYALLFLVYFSFASEKSYLWKIAGIKNDVYLMGSIHIGKASFYPLDSVIYKAFNSCENLVLEADPFSKESVELTMEFMANSFYKGDSNLSLILPKAILQSLRKDVVALGLPWSRVIKMRPWLLIMTLTQIKMQNLGFVPQHGVEHHFLAKAKQKQILELEGMRYQFDLIKSLNPVPMLEFEMKQNQNLEILADSLIFYWKNGRARELDQLMHKDLDLSQPENLMFISKFLFERNEIMAKKIEGYLNQSENYFIIVGAAHLAGNNSIQSYLLKNQIKTTQLGKSF
jgi:hypothetical protein